MSSKRRVDTGHHGLSGTPHLSPIGLPRNPMECEILGGSATKRSISSMSSSH
jgi:hypothetical protein